MKTKTKEPGFHAFDEMMHGETIEQKGKSRRGGLIVASSVAGFIAVAIIAVMSFVGSLQASEQQKYSQMQNLASTVSAGQEWQETKSIQPQDDSRGWLIREWKTSPMVNLDTIADKLGIAMNDVAYPAGCREGFSEGLLVQLCRKPDNRTVSLVIA